MQTQQQKQRMFLKALLKSSEHSKLFPSLRVTMINQAAAEAEKNNHVLAIFELDSKQVAEVEQFLQTKYPL